MTSGQPPRGEAPRRGVGVVVVLLVVGLSAVACADGAEGSAASPDGTSSITVSAASSLRSAFAELAAELEADDGVEVSFNFDSSSSLAAQILDGAPADVFASASPQDVERLVDASLVDSFEIFAGNELVIVTAPGNPTDIASLADLAGGGVVSLCGDQVPCGRYAQRALDAAGVSIPESNITRGQNVAATLSAVAEGDAVAAVVYVSDAISARDRVEAVPIVPVGGSTASYAIAVLDEAPAPGPARDFVELVLSEAGQAVLQEHGFLPPG